MLSLKKEIVVSVAKRGFKRSIVYTVHLSSKRVFGKVVFEILSCCKSENAVYLRNIIPFCTVKGFLVDEFPQNNVRSSCFYFFVPHFYLFTVGDFCFFHGKKKTTTTTVVKCARFTVRYSNDAVQPSASAEDTFQESERKIR